MGADTGQITGWLQGRLPDAWFTEPAEVTVDREEILVIGTLAAPEGVEGEADGPEATEAARGRISRFREETRGERISIAPRGRAPLRQEGRLGGPMRADARRCSPTSPYR